MSNACIVNTVEEWFANDCTTFSQTANSEFWQELFANFYGQTSGGTGPSNTAVYVPGVNGPTDDQLNFQNLLVDVCNLSANGGNCSSLWLNQCANYVRDDALNPVVRKTCGCYLPATQYNQQAQRTCDPICSAFGNARYFPTPTSTSPEPCASNVCVIDDVTIQVVNSTLGNITFQQLCSNCGVAGSCQCIVEDINIISTNSNVGALNLQQNCGGSLQCFATINGASQPVDCNQYLGSFSVGTVQQQTTTFQTFIGVYAVLTVIILIVLIIALIAFIRS